MKTMATILICYALVGCTSVPHDHEWLDAVRRQNDRVAAIVRAAQKPAPVEEDDDKCPPLPVMPANASRFEGRIHTLTVIALYEQCAASKK